MSQYVAFWLTVPAGVPLTGGINHHVQVTETSDDSSAQPLSCSK